MKRVYKCDNLEQITKKRKINLTINEVFSLPCDICKTDVYQFRECVGNYIYCSMDCLEVLFLKILNDKQYEDFEKEDIELMIIDDK